jgi:signal transduction histidine kinase
VRHQSGYVADKEGSVKKGNLLFLIIALIAVCSFLFSAFYAQAKKAAVDTLNEEQMIHAKQAAHGIEDFFATWTGVLGSLAAMTDIIDVTPEGKRYLDLFHKAHREQVRSITRADENGIIIYTVPFSHSIGEDISGQKHMREILKHRKPVVSDVFRTVQGFEAVALHVPVFKGNAFKGTIALVIDFQSLARRYLEVIRIGKTGYAWVISRDGTELYDPVPGYTGKSVFENHRAFPSVISMARDMLQGRRGVATYTFDRIAGQRVDPVRKHAVYLPIHIGNTFWSIAVASSEEEMLSSLASFRNKLILIVGILFLGGALFSLLAAKAWLIVGEEKKRKQTEEELRSLNETLDLKVRERTSELEAANLRLTELDRLKSMFIASMSHELRTPLNSIIGFTGILLQELAGPLNEEQRKQLGMVKSSSRHLLDLVTDIIDLSKIEAGKLMPYMERFDLARVAREALESFSVAADRKSLTLAIEAPQQLMLESDLRRVRQIIVNLIGNAVKFTDGGGVTVTVTERHGTAEVAIRDTGPGIMQEDMSRLFRFFSQIPSTIAQKHEGTGLGLYLSKKLANLLGGDIRVESEFGTGSIFTVNLPLQKMEAP